MVNMLTGAPLQQAVTTNPTEQILQQVMQTFVQRPPAAGLHDIGSALLTSSSTGQPFAKQLAAQESQRLKGQLGAAKLASILQPKKAKTETTEKWINDAVKDFSRGATIESASKFREAVFRTAKTGQWHGLPEVDVKSRVSDMAAKYLESKKTSGVSVNVNFPKATKPTINKIEGDIRASRSTLSSLNALKRGFKAEFLTWPEQLRQGKYWLKAKLKGGQALTPTEKRARASYSRFTKMSRQFVFDYIRSISGAQFSDKERVALRKAVPNPSDDPIAFQAGMDAMINKLRMGLARYNYTRVQGTLISEYNLVEMQEVIRAEMRKAGQKLIDQGLKPGTPEFDVRYRAEKMRLFGID